MHELSFRAETGIDILFECAKCQAPIGFNRPGIGKPFPVMDKAGTWQPPDDFAAYIGPCIDLAGDLVKAEAEVVDLKRKIAAAEVSDVAALAEAAKI